VKSALKSKKSMGTSTNGLGGIDHQDIPGLVLQILVCIGVDEDIVPLD
jgi:hypothetical protein